MLAEREAPERHQPEKWVGEAIKRARREAAMSLRTLSKLTDISASYLCEVENGRKYGPEWLVEKVAFMLVPRTLQNFATPSPPPVPEVAEEDDADAETPLTHCSYCGSDRVEPLPIGLWCYACHAVTKTKTTPRSRQQVVPGVLVPDCFGNVDQDAALRFSRPRAPYRIGAHWVIPLR